MNNNLDDYMLNLAIQESLNKQESQNINNKKKKCNMKGCKRKLGLDFFQCKCNGIYCTHHRLSFDHNCTFNHKKHHQDKLKLENTICKADKLKDRI